MKKRTKRSDSLGVRFLGSEGSVGVRRGGLSRNIQIRGSCPQPVHQSASCTSGPDRSTSQAFFSLSPTLVSHRSQTHSARPSEGLSVNLPSHVQGPTPTLSNSPCCTPTVCRQGAQSVTLSLCSHLWGPPPHKADSVEPASALPCPSGPLLPPVATSRPCAL